MSQKIHSSCIIAENERFHRADSWIRLQWCQELQSINVLKLPSTKTTKADWNIKCPYRILAYIYWIYSGYNIYWIFQPATYQSIVSYGKAWRKFPRTQKYTFIWISGVKRVENKKVNLWNSKEWFYHDFIHINKVKYQTNLKLVFNTFISIKGPIIPQNYPILSPSQPGQCIYLINLFRWSMDDKKNLSIFWSSTAFTSKLNLC